MGGCEFCGILGTSCIVCGGRPDAGPIRGSVLTDPASIHYGGADVRPALADLAAAHRPLVAPMPGCGCGPCVAARGASAFHTHAGAWELAPLALALLLAFLAGLAVGVWGVVLWRW